MVKAARPGRPPASPLAASNLLDDSSAARESERGTERPSALPGGSGGLLTLRQAANYLGYTERGLRSIVQRSADRNRGVVVRGATIRFMQAGPGGQIKFRQEWLDDFIQRYTVDPITPTTQKATRSTPTTTKTRRQSSANLDDLLCFT